MVSIRKIRLVWALAALFGLASLLLAAGRARAETLGFTLTDDAGPAAPRIQVFDDRTLAPITDAQASETTIAGGIPAVTVTRAGYASATIVGARSRTIQVFLKALPEVNRTVVASGRMRSWASESDRTRGSTVHAGLAIQSLSVFDLLDFDAGSVISPLKDTLDLGFVGDKQIPSNLMLPEQDIFVPLPLTLDKETYRLPVRGGEPTRLVGLQGEFDSGDILPAFQGGKMSLAALNKVKFRQAGLSETRVPNQDYTEILDANQALASRHNVTVSRPPFAADVLVVALADAAKDRQSLMPTDIKLAVDKEKPDVIRPVSLMAPAAAAEGTLNVMTLAMSDRGRLLSGILTPGAASRVKPGEFLGVPPKGAGPRALPETVAVRAPSTGIAAIVFRSDVLGASEKTVPTWYVYALPSAGEVAVPTGAVPGDNRYAARSYDVLHLDFGAGFDEGKIDGRTLLRRLQRFSRTSAKITP